MSAVLWQVFVYYLGVRYHTRFIDTCCIAVIGTLLYRKWSLDTVETHLGRKPLKPAAANRYLDLEPQTCSSELPSQASPLIPAPFLS